MKSAAETMKENFVGTRVCFRWWGQRRQVEKSVKRLMSEAVSAEADSITAGKKLYDTAASKSLREITALKNEIGDWWERETNPYGEPGVRLLPRHRVETFNATLGTYQARLAAAADAVQAERPSVLENARKRLGNAFSEGNYPPDLSELFAVEWSFPALTPARGLPPAVMEMQRKLFEAKLDEAVKLTHDSFMLEFKELVDHLQDKLTPGQDGGKKVFRDSAVKNLTEFFDRFKQLNPGDCDQLEKLVAEGEELLAGVGPDELRKGNVLREEIKNGLGRIGQALTPLVVLKPRRSIVLPQRRLQTEGAA